MTIEQLEDHREWIDKQMEIVDKVQEGDLLMSDQERVARMSVAFFALVNVTNGIIYGYMEALDELKRRNPVERT